jgi:hypothetical protein
VVSGEPVPGHLAGIHDVRQADKHRIGEPVARHLKVRRSAGAYTSLRGRERHADALQGAAEAEALGIGDRQTIHLRKARIALARRLVIIMHAMLRHGTEFKPA